MVVLFLILILFRSELPKIINNPIPRTNKATLILSLDNQKRTFEGEIIEGMTILDALNLSTSVGDIKFHYSIQDNGKVKVMAVDDHFIASSFGKLSIFLNSQPIKPSDINKVTIRAGDSVEIKAIK